MKKIQKGYKAEVNSDKGALRLAGEVIRSLLLDIKCPGEYTREMRANRINKVKKERVEFALGSGSPMIQSWCDITDYSYTKVLQKVLEFNKIT